MDQGDREGGYVTVEAEIAVVVSQAKECQEPSEARRSQEGVP